MPQGCNPYFEAQCEGPDPEKTYKCISVDAMSSSCVEVTGSQQRGEACAGELELDDCALGLTCLDGVCQEHCGGSAGSPTCTVDGDVCVDGFCQPA